jgi:hypothetical protein
LLNFSDLTLIKSVEKILNCHAGSILDMDTSDWGPYAITVGQDGCLRVYNYHIQKLALTHRFHDIGTCVIWLPCSVCMLSINIYNLI